MYLFSIQYGNHLQALAAAFNTIGSVSVNRVHQILGSVFGIPLATGTVSNIVTRLASVCNSVVERIKKAVIAAKVAHFDETGTRVDGKTKWVHTACTKDAAYLRIMSYVGTAVKQGLNPYSVALQALNQCHLDKGPRGAGASTIVQGIRGPGRIGDAFRRESLENGENGHDK